MTFLTETFTNCRWYGTQLSLASEILIVTLIVNSNRNSASVIRRQLLHVFISHPIGFEGLATMLVSVNMFSKLVLQSPTSRDVSALESPLRILHWTCCSLLSDLCSYIGYATVEFQASRLSVFVALGAWINHLPPVCLSTIWKFGTREHTCQMWLQWQWSPATVMKASSFPVHVHSCLTRVAIIRWTGGILSRNCSILFITVLSIAY